MSAEFPDDTVEGRYRLQAKLGAGGMGEVFRAVDEQLGRQVAVKIIKSNSATMSKRFEREYQALSQVKDQRVPEIYSWGVCKTGSAFLVMELVKGTTLEENLTEGNLSLDELTEIFMQICDGLTAIHEHGVVHRDIKPANIMVHKENDRIDVKIMDFGIVHLLAEDQRLTGTNDLVGSHGYFSPEHLSPPLIDVRSDIFSLGCIIYRAVTGALPFEDESALMSLVKMKAGQFKEPSSRIPVAIRASIRKCLAPNPNDRFQSAKALKNSLSGDISGSMPAPKPLTPTKRKGFLLSLLSVCVIVLSISILQKSSVKPSTSQAKDQSQFTLELSAAVQNRNWAKISVLCADLPKLRKKWWPGQRAELLGLLKEATQRAITANEAECALNALAVEKSMTVDKTELNEIFLQEQSLMLALPHRDLDLIERTLIARLKSGEAKTSFKKKILSTLGTIELIKGRGDSSLRHFSEALAIPSTDDGTRTQDILLATRWVTVASASRKKEGSELLLSKIPVIRSLISRNSFDNDIGLCFFNALYSIPLSVRGQKSSRTMISVISEAQKQHRTNKREKSQKIYYQILKGLFEHDFDKRKGEEMVFAALQEPDNHGLASDLSHPIVTTASCYLPIPGPVLVNLFKNDPASWSTDSRLEIILASCDTATLRYLFKNCKQPQLLCILPYVISQLASQLNHASQCDDADALIRELRSCKIVYDQSFVNEISKIYVQRHDKISLREMLAQIRKQAPNGSMQAVAAISLAAVLTELNEQSESSQLVTEVLHGSHWCQYEILSLLPGIYREQANGKALKNLFQKVWKEPRISEDKRVIIAANIADSCELLGENKEVDTIVAEVKRTKWWCQNDAIEYLRDIYQRRRDLNGLSMLFAGIQSEPNSTSDLKTYIRTLEAHLLLQDARNLEAAMILKELPTSKPVYSDRVIWNLSEAYYRLGDIDSMRELYNRLNRTARPPSLRHSLGARLALTLTERSRIAEAKLITRAITAKPDWISNDVMRLFSIMYARQRDTDSLRALLELSLRRDVSEEVRTTITVDLADLLKSESKELEANKLLGQLKDRAFKTRDKASLRTLEERYRQNKDIASIRAVISVYSSENSFPAAWRLEADSRFALDLLQLSQRDLFVKTSGDTPGQQQEAFRIIDRIMKQPDWDYNQRVVANLISCYEQMPDAAGSNELFERINNSPGCPKEVKLFAAASLAMNADLQGDARRASNLLDLVMTSPSWWESNNNLVEKVTDIYGRRGDSEKLLAILKCLGDKAPNSMRIKCLLARCLLDTGKGSTVPILLKEINSQLNQSWDDANAIRLAELYELTSDLSNLAQLYRSTIERPGPAVSQVGLKLARCLSSNKKSREADKVISEILLREQKPYRKFITLMLGHIYATQGSLPKLRQLYASVDKTSGGEFLVCAIHLVTALDRDGREAEATKILEKVRKDPSLGHDDWCLGTLSAIFEQRRDIESLQSIKALADELPPRLGKIKLECDLRLANSLYACGTYSEANKLLAGVEEQAFRSRNCTTLAKLGEIYTRTNNVGKLERIFDCLKSNGSTEQECVRLGVGMQLAQVLSATDKERATKLLSDLTKNELSPATVHASPLLQQRVAVRSMLRRLTGPPVEVEKVSH